MQLDRRRETRHAIRPVTGLRLTARDGALQGRTVMAQLVNASEGGLGVEAFASFEPGEMLEVRSSMVSSELSLHVTGVTRVAWCRELEPGRYRIGLELTDIALQRVA
jgi:hypothetical protein